jgi:hypothetical protein
MRLSVLVRSPYLNSADRIVARISREHQTGTPHAWIIANIDFGPDAAPFMFKKSRGEEHREMTSLLTKEEAAIYCQALEQEKAGKETEMVDSSDTNVGEKGRPIVVDEEEDGGNGGS